MWSCLKTWDSADSLVDLVGSTTLPNAACQLADETALNMSVQIDRSKAKVPQCCCLKRLLPRRRCRHWHALAAARTTKALTKACTNTTQVTDTSRATTNTTVATTTTIRSTTSKKTCPTTSTTTAAAVTTTATSTSTAASGMP